MDTTAEAAEPAAKRSRCANPNVEGNAARKQSFSQQDENVSGAIAVVSERATTETTQVNKLRRPQAPKNITRYRDYLHMPARAQKKVEESMRRCSKLVKCYMWHYSGQRDAEYLTAEGYMRLWKAQTCSDF